MAHLDKLPTYFVKDGKRRAAYFTVQAQEWRERGFVEEGAPAKVASQHKPSPERPVVAGGDGFENLPVEHETEDLEEMTKVELLEYALERGVDLKNALPKAEIYAECLKIQAAEAELDAEEAEEEVEVDE